MDGWMDGWMAGKWILANERVMTQNRRLRSRSSSRRCKANPSRRRNHHDREREKDDTSIGVGKRGVGRWQEEVKWWGWTACGFAHLGNEGQDGMGGVGDL
jgi:hypothetical protein